MKWRKIKEKKETNELEQPTYTSKWFESVQRGPTKECNKVYVTTLSNINRFSFNGAIGNKFVTE